MFGEIRFEILGQLIGKEKSKMLIPQLIMDVAGEKH